MVYSTILFPFLSLSSKKGTEISDKKIKVAEFQRLKLIFVVPLGLEPRTP